MSKIFFPDDTFTSKALFDNLKNYLTVAAIWVLWYSTLKANLKAEHYFMWNEFPVFHTMATWTLGLLAVLLSLMNIGQSGRLLELLVFGSEALKEASANASQKPMLERIKSSLKLRIVLRVVFAVLIGVLLGNAVVAAALQAISSLIAASHP